MDDLHEINNRLAAVAEIEKRLYGVLAVVDGLRSGGEFDLIGHLVRQRDFSVRTFGPGERLAGVTDHIRKELDEVAKAEVGQRLAEWVDIILLALDGAWRSGATPHEIAHAIAEKQRINEGRKWPDWRTQSGDKAIEHDRTGEVRHV